MIAGSRARIALSVALLAVVVATTGGCTRTLARHPAAAHESIPTLYGVQHQIDEYVDSGRYAADFAAVTSAAQAWMEKRTPRVKKPAIVLDIDETSLSNWRAYRVNGWARVLAGPCDLEHGPCGIRTWQGMGQSTALAHTLALVRRARELGVAVFFVTGRPPELRASTERNLRDQGFVWNEVILIPADGHFRSAVDFKAPERRKLAERGYDILLSMGDQQSDLDGGYAEKTFKLPNPVYFLP